MPDYDTDDQSTGADPWAAPVTAANGLPDGVPGLPVGSTGQTPAPAPAGPRADPQPLPDFTPPPLQGPIPNAPGNPFVQAMKDFATGNTQVGGYQGGGTIKTSTDTSRDLGRTVGQMQHDAAEKAAHAVSPYDGMY